MATAYRIEPASSMAVIGACARIARDLAKEVSRGRLSDAQREQVLARLTAVDELEQLADARVARVLQNLQSHYGETRYRRAPLLSRLQFMHGAFHA